MIGLYALNLLPINYFGLALVLLGIVFLTVEAWRPCRVPSRTRDAAQGRSARL
jgi:membrane-bound ClpP family serine protease